jgi:hypothetical protein
MTRGKYKGTLGRVQRKVKKKYRVQLDGLEYGRATQRNFNTIRTGRANSALLDRISVEYYGADTPLKSLATLSKRIHNENIKKHIVISYVNCICFCSSFSRFSKHVR